MYDNLRAILYAILAAILYSLMTPVSKLLLISVSPVKEAGLLYLGAGVGMSIVYVFGKKGDMPSVRKEDTKYVLAMVVLDMLAPVCLLAGLSMSTPESVSLLNNFEIVATATIAMVFFNTDSANIR